MNDYERELWVINTESLYLAQKHSRMSMRKFLRVNREAIDGLIAGETGGMSR
jgi:hypothetical protein